MCGIVGYIGQKSIESVLIVGLKKLEYRGYDSAGIAIVDRGELIVDKAKGKISELEEEIKGRSFQGQLGIGHTRWATHGEPSKLNAHPHINQDRNIAVVQNGIIENFLELKEELKNEGYVFTSETDTEIIAHLITTFIKQGFSPEQSFLRALHRLDGKFAIAVIFENVPNKIFFARNGAPLIVGSGELQDGEPIENFLASDLPAIVPLARMAYYVKDGEWGYINHSKVELFNWEGESLTLDFQKVDLKVEEIEKGDYPHFMLKEIYEQPDIIENMLKKRILPEGKIRFDEMEFSREYLSKLGRILIQACGTSLNAGLIGKLYLEMFAKIYTNADFSSEFRYRNPVAEGDTLVIGISQSGETADTLAGLHEAKAKFLKVLSFLNNPNSTLSRESDAIIHLLAGHEIGVASTKAYTSEVLHLFLFSLYVGGLKWILPKDQREELVADLLTVPEKIREILNNVEPIQKVANYLKDVSDTVFLGRTFNYATALEGALKLKEISYIHASGYAGGEFKHGPIALIDEGVPVVIITPKGEIREKMISNLQEVKARKGVIISVITKGDEEIKGLSDFSIEIPDIGEELSPLLTVVPLQLLAYYTALYRGCDVDKPRNLAKSVTVE